MVNIFDPKQPKATPPNWLRWSILGFVLLAGLNAYRAQVSDEPSHLKVENYPEVDDLVSANRWQRIMNPHHDVSEEEAPQEEMPSEPVASDASQFEETKPETPKEPEDNEPDSESPASDQTITDDGGDSESR